VIIRGNGDVLPCPNFYGTELIMGNLYRNTIKEIFNTTMKKLREEFRERIYSHAVCQKCSKGIYEIDISNILKAKN
jgi:radical SAM protein with 4Fe4S-binding SPASM domain